MGYTTTFSGKFEFSKPLTPEQVAEFNRFCEERHGTSSREFPGCPSFWCDWETDGSTMFWNGSEKSYNMDDWARILVERFLKPWGVEVRGEIGADGEAQGDVWKMIAEGYTIRRANARIVYEETT